MCECQCRHNLRWLHLASQLGNFPPTASEHGPEYADLEHPEYPGALEFGPVGVWYYRCISNGASFPAVLLTLYSADEATRLVAELNACTCCARHQLNRP